MEANDLTKAASVDSQSTSHLVPLFTSLRLQVVDETTFAMAGVQAKQWEEEKEVALKNAESSCAKAIDVLLKQGAPESQLCALHV